MWTKVRELTGKGRVSHSQAGIQGLNISAEQLNLHYAKISTDINYEHSSLKSSVCCSDSCSLISDYSVFKYLDSLKPTASGPDQIPYWFLKIAAPSLYIHLIYLYNLSLTLGIVPLQWKTATIKPIPKIPSPQTCSDFRPISLTPIVSRLLEKLVVRLSIYPLFSQPSTLPFFHDQFAFRPTGSTQSAIIAILHHITTLLQTSKYVRLIALDFSKAFDTLRHSTTLTKLSTLPVQDIFYNWFVNYFQSHSHSTLFNNHSSSVAQINASVFQGSAVGRLMFVVNGVDLKPINSFNTLDKYADDTYLIVSSNNESTIDDELNSIERWAENNNLTLNKSKSPELIIYPSIVAQNKAQPVASIPSIARVTTLKILGVTFGSCLSVSSHITETTLLSAQSLYALKVLKTHGLDSRSLHQVCHSTLVSRLTYASPSWWGLASCEDKAKMQSVLNRAKKWGLCDVATPPLEEICAKLDTDLFNKVIHSSNHVLHHLLPPLKSHTYQLRPRSHDRQLLAKGSSLFANTFIQRMLFKDIY